MALPIDCTSLGRDPNLGELERSENAEIRKLAGIVGSNMEARKAFSGLHSSFPAGPQHPLQTPYALHSRTARRWPNL